ncbi:MAG TPA: glycosyltransferase family 4 protein [Beijerinckiaceae bacterium]|nr:glycosyltransferase family 4 protein [Beijerinckiaceae bacterium]
MVEVAFAIPGDLATPTGGYAYDRRMLELLPARGVSVRHIELPGSFPNPTGADLAQTERQLRSTPAGAVLLIDGLAYGAIPADLIRRLDRRVVALVHHPLGLEAGLAPERELELLQTEIAALAEARWVITTSMATARLLAEEFDVPSSRITVAEPGTEPAPRASGTGTPVELLAVGAVSPRKAYGLLVEALSTLQHRDWRLTIAGALDRAPEAAGALRAAITSSALADRILLPGAVTDAELAKLYDRADIFVSPSLFEGYGMVLTEAMARGLPMVASTGGAAAETVPETAGLKVPPGDVAALRAALEAMIVDPNLRRTFADGSWAAAHALPRWNDAAARIAEVVEEVAA